MAKKPQKHISDKGIEHLRNNYDLGNGVEFTMASDDGAGHRTYSHYYTNKLPKLEINMANAKRTITVEASCIEEDDKKMLHYLYQKTKTG